MVFWKTVRGIMGFTKKAILGHYVNVPNFGLIFAICVQRGRGDDPPLSH